MDQTFEFIRSNLFNIILAIFSGIVGYYIGLAKTFYEGKQKAYSELLPPILRMAFNGESIQDEKDFNSALAKLWLYGSKDVTKKMDTVIGIIHDKSRGNLVSAAQIAVIAMRQDIQLACMQRLKPEDVNHLYTELKKSQQSG